MNRVQTVYLVHHSHTDIGYTHDQPVVWDLHGRFISEAVRLAGKYAASTSDGAFRWTVENTAVLADWLQHAAPAEVQAFVELEKAGRIEVTGMFANMTPLPDAAQLAESLQLAVRLREQYGFQIQSAMNCDVNGEPWPLVDALLDQGITGFTMAINTHFGGAPLHRPDVFWWEGPSGRKILAYNGWPYDTGWRFGIGQSEELLEDWWPKIEQRLEEIDYPLPVLMMQSFHPFGDNGPAFEEFTTFIDAWNAKGKTPHIVMATPRMWWDAVRPYADRLPTYRGDWTDFWNFGCASSARETAVNRGSRLRLRAADALAAAVLGQTPALPSAHLVRTLARYRIPAWNALHLWDEHTWGADLSLRAPYSEDTAAQWYHKAAYAYQARSLSLLLQRDALADFSRLVAREFPTDLLLFNPLPFARRISGEVPQHVSVPRGRPEDATSGRHSQDRVWSTDLWVEAAQKPEGTSFDQRLGIPPTEVPGYGYAVLQQKDLVELTPTNWSEAAVIENGRFRLTFDTAAGGVTGLFDSQLGCEWVDPSAGYPLNGFVHEEVADHAHTWPRWLLFYMQWGSDQVERDRGWRPGWRANRAGPSAVRTHRVYRTPFGQRVVQELRAPGIEGDLVQTVFLPDDSQTEQYIEFESWWVMREGVHPESTYVVFPFQIPGAAARVDLGGQAMRPGEDQIPGVCYDYYTAQQWVDLSSPKRGVTVALPDNPMVMFGGFHFGANQSAFSLERPMLLSWVTNTYWETNFRTHQPGQVHARYRVYPHAGDFELSAAARAGLETACSQPLLQHLGEPPEPARFPAAGQLLRLPEVFAPESAVQTLHIQPARAGDGLVACVYNGSGREQAARVGSALLHIQAAQLCGASENALADLPVRDGEVTFQALPGRMTFVKLTVTS